MINTVCLASIKCQCCRKTTDLSRFRYIPSQNFCLLDNKVGFEPTTYSVIDCCSAIELLVVVWRKTCWLCCFEPFWGAKYNTPFCVNPSGDCNTILQATVFPVPIELLPSTWALPFAHGNYCSFLNTKRLIGESSLSD